MHMAEIMAGKASSSAKDDWTAACRGRGEVSYPIGSPRLARPIGISVSLCGRTRSSGGRALIAPRIHGLHAGVGRVREGADGEVHHVNRAQDDGAAGGLDRA